MKIKKIILVGGGTGGHASPIGSIYGMLRHGDPELDILVIGSGSTEEKVFFEKIPTYRTIRAGKLHRYFTLKNIAELINFFIGFFQSFLVVASFKPDLIFSKGGYVSLPVILSAKVLRVPYMFHESDIEMGKANRFMAKDAKKVFVSYPVNYYPDISSNRLVFSGPILRPGFLSKTDVSAFQFEENKPTILVTGGSQGSLNITRTFLEVGQSLLREYNVIHQAGKNSINEANLFLDKLSIQERGSYYLRTVLPIDHGDGMAAAISLSDVVITRAGSTILEIAAMKKPMILIPWQHAASDHQNKNADFFLENKAAIVIREKDLSSKLLYSEIKNLLCDSKKMEQISKSAGELIPKDGLDSVVNAILSEVI